MAQNIRITITPEIEKALHILRRSTSGTLNTTELIKLSIGELARIKQKSNTDLTADEIDMLSSNLFQQWTKEDNTIDVDNIARPGDLKPYKPKLNVRTD